MKALPAFHVEQESHVMIVVPLRRISDLADPAVSEDLEGMSKRLVGDALKYVLVDFANIQIFGSCMLEILLRLRRELGGERERLILSELSEDCLQVLRVSGIEKLVSIYSSRSDALAAISS